MPAADTPNQVDATVKDYVVANGTVAEPEIVYSEEGDKPYIAAARVVSGPGGKLAALVESSSQGSDYTKSRDLFVCQYDGTNWADAVNRTNNDGKAHTTHNKTRNGHVSTDSLYRSRWSVGVFDAAGHLGVLMTSEVRNRVDYDATTSGGVGVVGGASLSTYEIQFVKVAP